MIREKSLKTREFNLGITSNNGIITITEIGYYKITALYLRGYQSDVGSTVLVLSVSRFCLDFPENPVRIMSRFSVRCLSVRILFKNSLSGICMDIVVILSVWISIDINTMPEQRHLSIRMWTQNLKTPTQTRTRMSERTYKNFESQTRTLVGIKSDS